MKSLRLITIGLCCVAAPLAAQDTTHARHERMGAKNEHAMMNDRMHEMMGPMMRAMAFTPDHLLSRKDTLGLTPQQVTRLTAIRDAAKSAHDAAAADAKAHMAGVGQAAGGTDTMALKMHFDAAHAAMGKAHWAMLAAAARARAVLTDAQRTKVEAWASAGEHRQH